MSREQIFRKYSKLKMMLIFLTHALLALQLFLNVLPSDRNNWITKTIKSRALYNNVKEIVSKA